MIVPMNLTNIKVVPYPSRTYRLTEMPEPTRALPYRFLRIAGLADGIEAIKQRVYHILATERYAYDIYDDSYGIELQQYIGKGFDYLKAGIRKTLHEALTYDDRITDVRLNSLKMIDLNKAKITFTVYTTTQDIEMEMSAAV